MKILLLVETLTTGGAETFVVRLAKALAARHEVIVAVMHGHRIEPHLREQLGGGIELHALRLPMERWLWRADGALRRLRIDFAVIRSLQKRWLQRLVARIRPDVIHSHLLKADRLAFEAASAASPPVRHVITLHGDYAPYMEGQADPLMLHAPEWMARLLRSADATVAICRQHLDHVRSDYPECGDKVHLIYNGYEPPPPGPAPVELPSGKFLFGMVSRGVEKKGWRLAVEAFQLLNRESAALVFVGDGPAIQRLRREKPPGVLFAGFSAAPTQWIRNFDVCLLPTLFPHESLPTAIIEYLACGKPVIATDVGEIGEMLRAPDGSMAGELLPFADGLLSAQALAAAMARLMDDPALRATRASAAQAAFPRFAMKRCVAAYENLYREVVSSSSTKAIH